ncbi:MAG: ATP-binding protein [Thermodesulfobacteriota bacterium]
MIISAIPILLVDLVGSFLMIILSLLSLKIVFRLRKQDHDNLIWTYLWWICVALSCFAVSRSAGHILKNLFLLMDQKSVWDVVRPFSGAVNTVMFVVVGSVTMFFERIWKIYQLIRKDRQALRSAHKELLYLAQNLEKLVAERTSALAVSEYNYRKIFEVSKDMILVTDREGTIVNLNPSGYNLLGLGGKEDVIDRRKILEFLKEPEMWLTIMASVEQERSPADIELDLIIRDNTIKRVLVSGSMVDRTDNETETFHFLIKDIQKRKMMEEQLAQADKLASIGELSSGVAHEVNNPLGVILGYTQLLLRDEKKATDRYADLKIIEKHARSCKAIVEDLLSFSRKSDTEKEMLDIHKVIDDVLSFVQHHSNIEHIALESEYSPAVHPLLIDEKKVKQVLINLVVNAIHAVGKKGCIMISTDIRAATGDLVVKVSDDGHGIEKKYLKKIFDPFFTTKPTGEGTGLGLSVSYGIVKNHGGYIDVESTPGKGTTFTISLPAAPSHQEN